MDKKKIIVPLVIAAAVAAYAASRALNKAPGGYMEVSGMIECEDVAVGSKEGGRVAEALVEEGAEVKKGDVLVRLEGETLAAMLEEARAAARMAEAALAMLKNGYTREEIDAARAAAGAGEWQAALLENGTRPEQVDAALADWEAARLNYENLKKTYERQEALYDSGVVSRQALDNAGTAMESAAERMKAAEAMFAMAANGPRAEEKGVAAKRAEEARARLRRMEKGPREEEVASAAAALEQAWARARMLETRLAETEIRAPGDAIVDVLDLYPGDLVAPGEAVARLILSDKLWVRMFVPEDKVGFAARGRKVEVRVDSFPAEKFRGTISRVAREAEFTPRNVQTPKGRASQVFRTKIIIDDPGRGLRSGMTAIVRISTENKWVSGSGSRVSGKDGEKL